jgi:hypothetical protein
MTDGDRADLPAGEWRALATEVTPRFVAHLDLENAQVPKGARVFLKLPKSFSLSRSGTDGLEANRIVETLAIYGETGQAGRAAAEFAAFPLTTHRVPDPGVWQIAIHAAWFFARRHGDASTVAALDGLLELVPRARLTRAYFDGTILHDPLELPPEVQEARPARARASSYILQLGTLASMAAYGGSEPYPLARIDAEVERYLAALSALPGFAPNPKTN